MGLYWHFVDLVWVFIFAAFLSLVENHGTRRGAATSRGGATRSRRGATNTPPRGQHHIEGQQHPLGIYFKIWGLLFVLSTASYLVDYFHFQGYLRWTLIIVFMLMKAGLIVAVFMHMLWERLAMVYAILLPPIAVAGTSGDRSV